MPSQSGGPPGPSRQGIEVSDQEIQMSIIEILPQATEDTKESLTNAGRLGQERWEQLVQERLLPQYGGGEHRQSNHPI